LFVYAIYDMNATNLSLGAELRARRRARGWTQADLARRTRLSRALVIRAEQGDPTISIGNVAKLFGATGAQLRAETTRLPTLEEVGALFADE
jgi:transcriptional regulator with XRE-family HTH domain